MQRNRKPPPLSACAPFCLGKRPDEELRGQIVSVIAEDGLHVVRRRANCAEHSLRHGASKICPICLSAACKTKRTPLSNDHVLTPFLMPVPEAAAAHRADWSKRSSSKTWAAL